VESKIPALDRLSVRHRPSTGLGRTRLTEQQSPETTDASVLPQDITSTLPLG
jgi:hypothetical protein